MPKLKTRNLVIPQIVFAVLMLTTFAGWKFSGDTLNTQSVTRFEQEASHLHKQIEARFDTYAQVLRGGVGLFDSSDKVTRAEWSRYINGLKLSRYLPAMRGMGYTAWVGGAEMIGSHEEALRGAGFPTFTVRPAGNRVHYTSIIYLEPLTSANRSGLGYDMFSETIRRAAMERARDTGEPSLSGKLMLLKEVAGADQAGFILYMPVYRSENGNPITQAARRESLQGFVFSPFRADDLMKGILRPGISPISFRIYDGMPESADSLLYDASIQLEMDRQLTPAQFETSKTVNIAGRTWHIAYSSTPSFTKTTESALPWVLLATGTLVSLLMSIVAWMLLSARMRVTQKTSELRKQAEINSVLLENLAEGVVACDADFTDILMNKKAREWFELDPRKELDLEWIKRIQMFEKDGITPIVPGTSPLFRAVAGSVIESEEICIVAPGQEPRFVLVTGGPLPDIDDLKSGALLSLRDISEYRLAMKNIERQQNFLSDVIDNIPNLISARDRDGHHVLANRAYAEGVYGMSPEQLIAGCSRGDVDESPPDDSERQENLSVIGNGGSLTLVRTVTMLDGQQRWFSIGKLPIRSNEGSDNIVLTVASDITDLKISEERVRVMNQELENRVKARTTSLEEANHRLAEATQIAEAANLAKSSFLAAMSHEIRTPMNGVVGMVEVLINESRNKELSASLQMVLDSAFSLLGIIDDILDFSKIEAGQFELENTTTNLGELIEHLVRASVPLARKTNTTISLYIDPAIPQTVLVDVTRFRQLLTNLVGNAIKFSGKQQERDGHVEVRAFVLHAEPLTLQVDVIDNGVGMSPDTQERIFDSFVQAESSITRRFGGSGLGLSICKRIIEMMDGNIVVESELGKGSRFSVALPLEAAHAEAVEDRLENIEGVNCVLVDSTDYRAADMTKYLISANANVLQVADIDAAVTTLHTIASPAVVLCTAGQLQERTTVSISQIPIDTGHVVVSPDEHSLGIQIRNVATRHSGSKGQVSAVVVDYNALRRKTLIEAVAIAVGRASPEIMHAYVDEDVMPTIEPLSVEDAMAAGTCILVVEDDSVNRMVIRRQLALLGQTAEFAENGSEALLKWRKGNYGLVFTDLHMPIMDGYTMTKAIREEEPAGEGIPIVALTANALSGETRRAANAGVDGYLTKPLRLSSLQDAIKRHLVISEVSVPQAASTLPVCADKAPDTKTVFDPEVLMGLLGDDPQINAECLEEFLLSLDEVGNALASALKSKDRDTIDRMAHRLKSSSLSVGALAVWNLCKDIESARLDNDVALLASHSNELLLAMARTDLAISTYLADINPSKPARKAS